MESVKSGPPTTPSQGAASSEPSSSPAPPTVLQDVTNRPAAPPSETMLVTRYRQLANGWIECRKRVPVPKSASVGKRRKKVVGNSVEKSAVTHSDNYKRSIQHLYHKEKRFSCPDCEAWYAGDQRKMQLSCRHKQRYETKEELKMWNIGFSDDSDYADE